MDETWRPSIATSPRPFPRRTTPAEDLRGQHQWWIRRTFCNGTRSGRGQFCDSNGSRRLGKVSSAGRWHSDQACVRPRTVMWHWVCAAGHLGSVSSSAIRARPCNLCRFLEAPAFVVPRRSCLWPLFRSHSAKHTHRWLRGVDYAYRSFLQSAFRGKTGALFFPWDSWIVSG